LQTTRIIVPRINSRQYLAVFASLLRLLPLFFKKIWAVERDENRGAKPPQSNAPKKGEQFMKSPDSWGMQAIPWTNSVTGEQCIPVHAGLNSLFLKEIILKNLSCLFGRPAAKSSGIPPHRTV
jgi:hypothetical protein